MKQSSNKRSNNNPTLRDVAQKAGVGLATASRALRDDPSAAEKTRKRVKKAAEELGYKPDPAMSMLIERRWHSRRRQEGLNVAYLYNSQIPLKGYYKRQYAKFKAEAETHGYSLIAEDLTQFPSPRSLYNLLVNKGIAGVTFPMLSSTPYSLELIYGSMPAVSINVSAVAPDCPIVMHDEFGEINLLWNRLRDKGYKRIAPILGDYHGSMTSDLRLGAVLARQYYIENKEDQVPIIFYDPNEQTFSESPAAWFEKYKPDVIIGFDNRLVSTLGEHGIRIPHDVDFATFNLWQEVMSDEIAGYWRNNDMLFRRCLEILYIMIRSSTAGKHHQNLRELVSGKWVDGKTLQK